MHYYTVLSAAVLLLTVAVAASAAVAAVSAAAACCRRLPFMFLLLLFIRLFERQRNGRVAKLPLRTFFAFAVAVAVTARAYFTLFDVLLWACVCVRALPCRTLLHFTTAHKGVGVHSFSLSLSRALPLSRSLPIYV